VAARLTSLVLVALAGLTLAGDSRACVCGDAPIEERLDDADAAVVGRIVSDTAWEPEGGPSSRRLTVRVEQRVKGEVDETLSVLAPSGTDCDVEIPLEKTTGFLLTRTRDGEWFASACSLVAPGELVAAGGEPRGTVIKVAIGLVILGLVLAWAFRRRARGARPNLPGAPTN
jgi:MYXO-CTERM domain-containing protein